MLKQWNSNCGTLWGHSGTARWNSVMEQWDSNGGTVMVEQWNIGGTVWWNSRTVMVEHCGGKVEQSCWISVVEP